VVVEPLDDGNGEEHDDEADSSLEDQEEEAPNKGCVFVPLKTTNERNNHK